MAKDTVSLKTSGTSIDKPGGDVYWPVIATKDQIPGWLRDNDFLISGHPMPTFSYRRSFRLWRCLHMETMNIWTHCIGSAAFLAAGLALHEYASGSSVVKLRMGDKLAFGASISAAVGCFALSTTFHTLRSHSYKIHHFWGRMDIFGICILAVGGGTSATYYASYCNPILQRLFWTINLISGAAAAFTLFDTGGGGNKMRALRGGVFSLLALSAMLPIFYCIGSLGWHEACEQIGGQWFLAEGLTLVIGVCLFVGRLPERLCPGSFDVWGHSHQLFHICAVVGTAFHVLALITGFNYRQMYPHCQKGTA